jgi:hypothetical protein
MGLGMGAIFAHIMASEMPGFWHLAVLVDFSPPPSRKERLLARAAEVFRSKDRRREPSNMAARVLKSRGSSSDLFADPDAPPPSPPSIKLVSELSNAREHAWEKCTPLPSETSVYIYNRETDYVTGNIAKKHKIKQALVDLATWMDRIPSPVFDWAHVVDSVVAKIRILQTRLVTVPLDDEH